LLRPQRDYLTNSNRDVEVEGDADCQQAVRFGLFHVLQAAHAPNAARSLERA
jgi:trehalose/maltose hydrolase-like predicted phosphorylase